MNHPPPQPPKSAHHSLIECHAIADILSSFDSGNTKEAIDKHGKYTAPTMGLSIPDPKVLTRRVNRYSLYVDKNVKSHLKHRESQTEVVATDDWVATAKEVVDDNLSITSWPKFAVIWKKKYHTKSFTEMEKFLKEHDVLHFHQVVHQRVVPRESSTPVVHRPQPVDGRSTEASSLAGPSDMAGLISDPQTLLEKFAAGGNTTIHLTLHQNQHQHTTNNTTNNNIAGDSFVGNKTTANTQQSHNGGGTGSGSSGNNSSDRSGDNNTAGDRNTGGDCTDDNREALANSVAGSVADLIRPDLASLKAQMVEVQTACRQGSFRYCL
jgi:hypothetical protein